VLTSGKATRARVDDARLACALVAGDRSCQTATLPSAQAENVSMRGLCVALDDRDHRIAGERAEPDSPHVAEPLGGRWRLSYAGGIDGVLRLVGAGVASGAGVGELDSVAVARLRSCRGAGVRCGVPPCAWIIGRDRRRLSHEASGARCVGSPDPVARHSVVERLECPSSMGGGNRMSEFVLLALLAGVARPPRCPVITLVVCRATRVSALSRRSTDGRGDRRGDAPDHR
jgi:hypothetical protein